MDLVYLVGPPGVGKSSVMAELTRHCERIPRSGPLPHDTLYLPQVPPQTALVVGAEMGRRREDFSGTDALGMSVQPRAVEWIGSRPYDLVLGEGARLGNVGFLHAARDAGYAVHLVHLAAHPDDLDSRRNGRGSAQAPAWVRGAVTRARRIMERMEMDADLHWIDTTGRTPAVLAGQITELVPALGALR